MFAFKNVLILIALIIPSIFAHSCAPCHKTLSDGSDCEGEITRSGGHFDKYFGYFVAGKKTSRTF